jgi:hypothetical protein
VTGLSEIYRQIADYGVPKPEMDPRLNNEISRLYQLGDNDSSTEAIQAGIVYNVLQGYTGPGVIMINECDYHDNTQATGDAKDLEIGRSLGRAVAAASLLKKPLFVQIITDGGITTPVSNNYERVWLGDQNQHSLSVFAYFDPEREVKLRKQQVGAYTDKAKVDQTTEIGKGTERMVLSTLANYLYLNGQLGQFESVSGVRLKEKDLEELLVFA